MELDVRTIDISQQLGQYPPGEHPLALVKKTPADHQAPKPGVGVEAIPPGVWYVLQSALPGNSADLQWSVEKGKGTHVAIPMIGYPLKEATHEQLVLFGAQIAAYSSWLAQDKMPFDRFLLLLSNVFSRPDGQPGYLVYAGLAIKRQEQ